MSALLDGRLLMIGAGNMGGAMLRRWLASGLRADQVTVVTPSGRAMPAGVCTVREVPVEGDYETVLLALKPQQIGTLRIPAVARLAPGLLVSILAGVEHGTLATLLRAGAIVRAMPNLPVELGKGVVALESPDADMVAREAAERLMTPLGLVEWVDAARFGAVAALAGCGPAFLFRFIDALAAAGEALGIAPEQAARLAAATVDGATALALGDSRSPSALADAVASPGGMTRAGLDALDGNDRLRALIRETLSAAEARGRAMAAASRAA